MLGLLLKDIFTLKKSLIIMIPLVLFYTGYFMVESSAAFSIGFIVFLFGILPISSFSYDEMTDWDAYALCLPLSRSDIVKSKYLLLSVMLVIGGILGTLSGVAGRILNGTDLKSEGFGEIILTVVAVMAICFIIDSISLPILFKLGAENGRIASLVVYCVPAAAIIWIANRIPDDMGASVGELPSIVNLLISHPIISLIILTCVFVFVSYKISLSVYNKKEF